MNAGEARCVILEKQKVFLNAEEAEGLAETPEKQRVLLNAGGAASCESAIYWLGSDARFPAGEVFSLWKNGPLTYQILKMASVRVGRWMYCSAAAYSMVARHCDNLCADVVLFGIWVKQQVTIVTHRLSRPDQHAILSRIWSLVLERALIISPF